MKNNQKLRHKLSGQIVFLVMVGLVSSCGNDDFSDLEKKIADIKAKPKKQIDPLPEPKIVEPFSFEIGGGARDPFQPVLPVNEVADVVTETANASIHPDPNRPKEDLELYPLDTLKMRGTLKKDETLWVLVESKDGTVHRVKTGNYMGTSDGKIIEISENEIKLMEIVPDKTPNTWREQPASVKLDATQ